MADPHEQPPALTSPVAGLRDERRSLDAHGEPPVDGGRETLLIVDDEEALVGVAKRMLESVGYATLTATGARDALRIAAQTPEPIHLLVTDVVMPEMNGPELATRLAKFHPETRVLFTSGYADASLLREAVHHRASALLAKPYAASDLRRRVRDLLDRGPETR
jgi:DNA-binding NtrC family response regulator